MSTAAPSSPIITQTKKCNTVAQMAWVLWVPGNLPNFVLCMIMESINFVKRGHKTILSSVQDIQNWG